MNEERVKVKNEPIVRDLGTGALLFTNRAEIEEYNKKKQKLKVKEDFVKTEINNLKAEISDIKHLLNQLINKDKN